MAITLEGFVRETDDLPLRVPRCGPSLYLW